MRLSSSLLCSMGSALSLSLIVGGQTVIDINAGALAPAPPPPPPINGKCGLKWFELNLTPESAILCKGDSRIPGKERYWAQNTPPMSRADAVVMPATTQDVAETIKVMVNKAPAKYDWTFVSGGHSNTNATTASGVIIDLQKLNSVQVLKNYKMSDGSREPGVISYGPGATWGEIEQITAGSGFVAVGARVRSVGAGGFTTGGGIGFLGGAYGYAIDRIIQMEVVLLDGLVVTATKSNSYSDLFWALQGGNGQFAIVTRFWVKAVPEPSKAEVGYYWIKPEEVAAARENVVGFFNDNSDPHSLIYWVRGFIPPSLVETDPTKLGINEVIVALRFADSKTPSQPSYDNTFAPLLSGLSPSFNMTLSMKYEQTSEGVSAFFPEQWRRLFQGPVVSTISVPYMNKLATRMDKYITDSLALGDPPASAIFALQYMSPRLNGNLPKNDADTAWPHSSASGHQTLFSPAWSSATNDAFVKAAGGDLNVITTERSKEIGLFPRDYPNYWSALTPEIEKNGGWDGSRYFGANLPRLVQIKTKYDPKCLLRKGPTFATEACKAGKYASIF